MSEGKCAITALLVVLFSVFWLSESYSDDSFVADHGMTVFPLKTNDISMVRESVLITMEDPPDSLRRARVECHFVFKNTTNTLIEATVGFPGNWTDNYAAHSDPITDFVTEVDGQRLNVTAKEEVKEEHTTVEIRHSRNWYIWPMKFRPKSTVRVKNTYSCEVCSESGYDPFYMNYWLSTGANWKGPIGKATIRVRYKSAEDLEKRVCEIRPKGWVRKRNEIVWKLRNFKPTGDDDIRIYERNVPLGASRPDLGQKPLLFKHK